MLIINYEGTIYKKENNKNQNIKRPKNHATNGLNKFILMKIGLG